MSFIWFLCLVFSADSFDVNLALGKWFQLANIPQFYEQNYPFCTTATYNMLPNASILITNSARSAQGDSCTVFGTGIADQNNPSLWSISLWGNSCSLSANFPQIQSSLQWLSVYPADDSYQLAFVVGLNQAAYLLSRTPILTPPLAALVERYHLTPTVQIGCYE